MKTTQSIACLLSFALLAGTLQAGTFIQVTVTGEVNANTETLGPLGTVKPGDPVTLSFVLNSDLFVNSDSYPIRGYSIKRGSFSLAFPTLNLPLVSPFPAGMTAYFCIANEHQTGDGFFLSTSVNSPSGLPLQLSGSSSGSYTCKYTLVYGNSELQSLDLLGVLGTYDISGLSSFDFTIDDGATNVVDLSFDSMTLELAVPWTDFGGASMGVAGQPKLEGFGPLSTDSTTTIQLTDAAPNAPMVAWLARSPAPFAALGGTVFTFPYAAQLQRLSDGLGSLNESFPWPAGIPSGIEVTLQFLILDPSAVDGIALSNAVHWTTY